MKIWYLKIIVIVPILLLVLQGCMLMHFIDDHHSKMMGHDSKSHADSKDVGHQGRAHEPIGFLDQEPRKDHQGDVTAEIQFVGLTNQGEIAFRVKMDSHTIRLDQYLLDQSSTLANDQGVKVKASTWETSRPSKHHVSGTLYFPSKDASGKVLFGPGTRKVTLMIKGLAGISERVFQWNVSSRS